MKKIFAFAVIFIVASAATALAQHEHKSAGTTDAKPAAAQTPAQGEAKLIDAGNKTCPNSGEKVSGRDFVTYKGVRYGLCCASCAEVFLKDPEKFIKKLRDKGEIK